MGMKTCATSRLFDDKFTVCAMEPWWRMFSFHLSLVTKSPRIVHTKYKRVLYAPTPHSPFSAQATRPENIAVDEACMQALLAQANRLSVSRRGEQCRQRQPLGVCPPPPPEGSRCSAATVWKHLHSSPFCFPVTDHSTCTVCLFDCSVACLHRLIFSSSSPLYSCQPAFPAAFTCTGTPSSSVCVFAWLSVAGVPSAT